MLRPDLKPATGLITGRPILKPVDRLLNRICSEEAYVTETHAFKTLKKSLRGLQI